MNFLTIAKLVLKGEARFRVIPYQHGAENTLPPFDRTFFRTTFGPKNRFLAIGYLMPKSKMKVVISDPVTPFWGTTPRGPK